MAKNRNDYFELVKTQVSYCVQASVLLEDILGSYATCNLEEQREHMHDIEHKADEIHHDILSSLSAEFITPIDQEDILRLVQIIDDVTDALDEVVLECHMFHIAELPQGVPGTLRSLLVLPLAEELVFRGALLRLLRPVP